MPQTLLCLNLRFSFVLLGVSICIRGAIGPALYSMGWVSLFGGFAIGTLDLVFRSKYANWDNAQFLVGLNVVANTGNTYENVCFCVSFRWHCLLYSWRN